MPEEMLDELAKGSLMSPLAGTKQTYVRLANVKFSHIFEVEWHITQLGILM